jgi:tRNA(Ile)-lysidine synthase
MSTSETSTRRLLERNILRYVRAHDLLPAGETVLAGVSGGADSTALLLLLVALAPRLRIGVHAAYFDHQLRGKRASQRERRAVGALAGGLAVPLSTGASDVRAYARERRIGIEEAARELRYRFLAETAREVGAKTVAVGHTADDQVETILMHILRGSGLSGLAGMLPRSPYPLAGYGSVALVRPLLETRRSETEAYCQEMGVEPLEDASNRSMRFRRNVVRYELLPLLREHVPCIDAAILRLARAAATEQQAIGAAAEQALARAGSIENGVARLSQAALREAPSGLRPQLMRLAASRLLGDARDIGERHLLAMSAAVGKPAGTELDLPRGLHLRIDHGEVVLTAHRAGPIPKALPVEGVDLTVPGETRIGGWLIEASLLDGKPALPESAREATLDVDALAGGLRVRRRRAGDRFRPLGLPGEKKLQDVFVDAKVSRQQRDSVPVVCDGAGIVWVAGYRIADRVKVTRSTRRVLRLRAGRNGGRRPAGTGLVGSQRRLSRGIDKA